MDWFLYDNGLRHERANVNYHNANFYQSRFLLYQQKKKKKKKIKKKKKKKKNRKKIDETFVDANLLYLSEAHLRWSIL